MKALYLLIATGLLILGIVFDWSLSRAQDNEKPVSALLAIQPDKISEIANLLDRVESLEKRLAALEAREPLVRQVDSRESAVDYQTTPVPPSRMSENNDGQEEVETQKINGQKWSFRLLKHK